MLLPFLRTPIFLISTGIGLAGLAVAAWTLDSKSDAQWQAMQDRLVAIESELGAISYEREPLGGPGTAGRAWDAYSKAYEGLLARSKVSDLLGVASSAAKAGPEVRRAETARLTQDLSFELAEVQRGARCIDATPPIEWTTDMEHPLPYLMHTSILVDVLTLQGLAQIEDGNVQGGCGMILDGMQLGSDLTQTPAFITQMIGISQTLPRALRGFLEHEGLHALPAEARRLLEAGVGTLMERAPKTSEYRGEVLRMGAFVLAPQKDLPERLGFYSIDKESGFTLAPRLKIANSVLALADAYEQLGDLQGVALRVRANELLDPKNPVLRGLKIAPNLESSFRYNFVQAGQLRRALRASLELTALPFEDPHGETLVENHDGDYFDFKVGTGSNPIELRIKR